MYDRWLQAGKSIGFELSLGKNFVHPRFLTVNSLPIEYVARPIVFPTIWADLDEFVPSRRVDDLTIHGYMNVGLLIGQSKLATGTTERTVPLSGWYAAAVLGAMNPGTSLPLTQPFPVDCLVA
jgi:hypothetical protein